MADTDLWTAFRPEKRDTDRRRFSRTDLQEHVERIDLEGALETVALEPDLSVAAQTEDGDLVLLAPALTDEPVFKGPVGLEAKKLTRFLDAVKRRDADEVEVWLTSEPAAGGRAEHLRVATPEARTTTGVTILRDPETEVKSKVADERRGEIRRQLSEVEWEIPAKIGKAMSRRGLPRSDHEVVLRIGGNQSALRLRRPDGGGTRFSIPDAEGSRDFVARIATDALNAALGAVSSWDDAEIVVPDPPTFLAVREAGYVWVVDANADGGT